MNVKIKNIIKVKINRPIIYLAGGLFGDFIHQLSVIKEKYLLTGRKGILYISNIGDAFRFGLENTYNNTYELIMKQDYIEDYKIHNNEPYEINLSSWRKNKLLLKKNFYYVFSNEYKIDWGKNKWINVEKDDKWKDKILVNETSYRFSNINYTKLYELYSNNIIFIAFKDTNYDDYEYFTKNTGLVIEYYNPINMIDLAISINSCKLFVGTSSGFMAIAYALHTNIINGVYYGQNREIYYSFIDGLDKIFKNISINI